MHDCPRTVHADAEPRVFLPIPSDVDGTVFQLSPPVAQGSAWTKAILHNFAALDGGNPYGGVTLDAVGNSSFNRPPNKPSHRQIDSAWDRANPKQRSEIA